MKLYKMFDADIGGNIMNDYPDTRPGRYLFHLVKEKLSYFTKKKRRYIYRIDIIERTKRRKRRNGRFLTFMRVKLYYGYLSYKMFRRLDIKARKKQGGSLGHFILFLECRVSMIVYRLFFTENIFSVKKFVYDGNFVINKKPLNLLSQQIGMYDIIQVVNYYVEIKIKSQILLWMKRGSILNKVPRFIFMNYTFMFGYIYKIPKLEDIVFPKNMLDYFRPKGKYGLDNLSEPTFWGDYYRGTDFS